MIRAAPLALLAVLLLAGCYQTRTSNQYRAVGSFNGQPVELTVQGAEATDAGVDPVAAVQASLAALRGDLAGVSAAIAAQPPPAPPLAPEALEAAVRRATPPAAPPPSTLTGNGLVDTLLAALAAYLGGKGTIAATRALRPKPKA